MKGTFVIHINWLDGKISHVVGHSHNLKNELGLHLTGNRENLTKKAFEENIPMSVNIIQYLNMVGHAKIIGAWQICRTCGRPAFYGESLTTLHEQARSEAKGAARNTLNQGAPQ